MHFTYDREIDFLYEDVRMPDKVWSKYQAWKSNLLKKRAKPKRGKTVKVTRKKSSKSFDKKLKALPPAPKIAGYLMPAKIITPYSGKDPKTDRRMPTRAKLKNDVYKYRPGGYRFKKASKVESGEGSISGVGTSAPKKFNFQRELNLPKKSTRNEPSYKKTVTPGDIAKKSAGMSSEPTEMDYKKTKIIDRNSKYKFSRRKPKDVLPSGIGYVQDNLEKRRKQADIRRKYGLAHKANYPYGGGLIGRIVGPASELYLPKKARVSRSKLRRINSNTGLDKVSRYNAVQGLAYRQRQNINKYL